MSVKGSTAILSSCKASPTENSPIAIIPSSVGKRQLGLNLPLTLSLRLVANGARDYNFARYLSNRLTAQLVPFYDPLVEAIWTSIDDDK